MKPLRLVAVALAAVLAVAARPTPPAAAAPKKAPKPACGMNFLPLVAGNSWTFKSGNQLATVDILSVTEGKDPEDKPLTTIEVKESYARKSITTTWTCNAAGLRIAPDSFFFAGEPGGMPGMTVTVTKREDVTLAPDAAIVQDAVWIEKVFADVARSDAAGQGATHLPSKLELERHVLVHPIDPTAVPIGQFGAQKITFELRGRALAEGQRVDLQPKRPGGLWLVKGLGPVKVMDAYEKTWELTATNLPVRK